MNKKLFFTKLSFLFLLMVTFSSCIDNPSEHVKESVVKSDFDNSYEKGIHHFEPVTAAPGSIVSIYGNFLLKKNQKPKVYFGEKKCKVKSANEHLIKIILPTYSSSTSNIFIDKFRIESLIEVVGQEFFVIMDPSIANIELDIKLDQINTSVSKKFEIIRLSNIDSSKTETTESNISLNRTIFNKRYNGYVLPDDYITICWENLQTNKNKNLYYICYSDIIDINGIKSAASIEIDEENSLFKEIILDWKIGFAKIIGGQETQEEYFSCIVKNLPYIKSGSVYIAEVNGEDILNYLEVLDHYNYSNVVMSDRVSSQIITESFKSIVSIPADTKLKIIFRKLL